MSKHTESYIRLFTSMHRAEKQYHSPLSVGDTVRIVAEDHNGKIGELRVIEPENDDEGDFYGVYLDSVGHEVFFRADEIERVENVDIAELPF